MKHSLIAHVSSALRASAHKDAREWRRYSILFLAFVLLMALLYAGVGHVVRQQRLDYAALTTELFSSQASAMFQELELVSNAILRNGTVFALAKDENPIIDRLEICDAMKGCMITSEYAEHTYLFPVGDGDIYTDEGIYSGNSRDTLLGQAGAREEDLFSDSDDAAFHVLNDNHMAPFAVTCVRSREGDVTSSLVVTMRMSQFMRMFQNIDAEMCTVFNDRVYISSYIKAIDDPDFSWRDEKAIGRLLGKPVTCFYLDGDGYTYMVAIDQARFNRPLNMLLVGFCAFTFILILLGMVHVYHSIKRRRTEIEKVLAVLPESYQGDQSYEQIYANIRKSLEDYRTQQADYLREQNDRRLHQLLTQESGHPLTSEELSAVGIDSGAACYYVVTYFATNLHQPVPEKEHPRDAGRLLHMLFISTMQEVAGRYSLPYGFCCGYKIATAVFWGNDADALKQTILDISENVMELMTNSIAMHMQVTVSSPVCDFTRLPEAYEETHRLRSFAKSINSTTAIICQEDLAQDSSVLLNGDFIRQEQILINTILVRKYDAVPSMVAALLSGHVSTLRKNYALAQSRLTSISNILLEGVRMSGLPDLAEIAEAKLSRAGSVEELIAAATNMYSRMDDGLQQRQVSTDYVDIACDYIAQNLSDQNLNVSAICEATGISVQKLTRLFQNRFGMAIAEYVNACRIKRAKELLANPELTAVSIAQQIGYSNADTFTRNFKKIEGVTPTEYRKAL